MLYTKDPRISRGRVRYRRRWGRRWIAAAWFSSLAAFGCEGDEPSQSEYALVDSYYHPTDHGELVFGVANEAVFTQAERFHAWTFALSAQAKLTIGTDPRALNLDTVVYLYRRDEGASSWGSYLDKNDDHDGSMASRLTGSYAAGEYRLIVKAKKLPMLGAFDVVATCEGDGCPVPEPKPCPEPATRPAPTPFTAGCPQRLQTAVLAEVTNFIDVELDYAERCDYGEPVARAIDYYREYWTGLSYWDELVEDFDDPENPSLVVRASFHEGGSAVVSVNVLYTDTTTSFVMNDNGELLLQVVHAAAATQWFTGLANEPLATEPDSGCLERVVEIGPHQPVSEPQLFGSGSCALSDDEPFGESFYLIAVLREFTTFYGIASDEPVSYSFETWHVGHTDVLGSRVQLWTAEHSANYLVGVDDWGNQTHLLTRTDATGTSFVCTTGGP